MRTKATRTTAVFTGVSLALYLAISAPIQAQEAGGGKQGDTSTGSQTDNKEYLNVKVNVEMENGKFTDAIRLLFKDAKKDYFVASELSDARVTVNFRNLPFKDALPALLKVSSLPIEYKIEDDIYKFNLRKEEPLPDRPVDDSLPPPMPEEKKVEKIPVKNVDARGLADGITGKRTPPPRPIFGISTNPGSARFSSVSFINGVLQSRSAFTRPDGRVEGQINVPIDFRGVLMQLLTRGRIF